MTNTQNLFDALQAAADRGASADVLQTLIARLKEEDRYHELFDARLMEARISLGLPAILTGPLDDLQEPLRTKMEDAYVAACSEVGEMLLSKQRVREAWMYLRPVGDRTAIKEALSRVPLDTENYEQVIEVALYEAACPRLGLQFVLAHYGTCNAITLYDGHHHAWSKADRQEAASLMVEHLHAELLQNVKSDIARREGTEPTGDSLLALAATRPWLFENENYHVDTTHLAAVVRFALSCDTPAALRTAVDLTEYGRRLSETYRFASPEPFADSYVAHRLFFRALLGEEVDEAIGYFRAKTVDAADAAPAEVLIALLARLGRDREAFEAAAELLPSDARTSGFAPGLLELARRAGCYERLVETSRARNDVLGFAAGLLSRGGK